MNGELGYKDVHGRVWHIRHRSSFSWLGETMDVGHTIHHHLSGERLEILLASIDREEFTTDSRSTRPISEYETRDGLAESSGEGDPERLEEIRANAQEIDGHFKPLDGEVESPPHNW